MAKSQNYIINPKNPLLFSHLQAQSGVHCDSKCVIWTDSVCHYQKYLCMKKSWFCVLMVYFNERNGYVNV